MKNQIVISWPQTEGQVLPTELRRIASAAVDGLKNAGVQKFETASFTLDGKENSVLEGVHAGA